MSYYHMMEGTRFARQAAFDAWGSEAQESLGYGRVLVIGMGGLGSWAAELLVRAGVGFLRLADDDLVDLMNIHRQALYGEHDAQDRRMKVHAAADRLKLLNHDAKVDASPHRVDRFNIARLADDVHLIVDGTDNFAARFLINDYCVKTRRPWVFAGVVRTEAQIMTIIPGRTPCLRCVMECPPAVCTDPSCRQAGVLGPAVSAIASFQAMEAMKLLVGRSEAASPYLLKMDMWDNTIHRLLLGGPLTEPPCPCCGLGEYEYLEP